MLSKIEQLKIDKHYGNQVLWKRIESSTYRISIILKTFLNPSSTNLETRSTAI